MVTPLLLQLHLVTGHAVHLGVLEGNHVRYIQKIGSQMVPDLQTRVGSRIPAQSSTIGKSLLRAGRRSVAPLQNTNEGRQQAVAFGICNSGMGCIGARIGVLDHLQVGLSICGPLIRGTIDKKNAAPVQMAAVAISQYFGVIDGFGQEKTG
ncbi:hypothetical protein O4214_10690 [Rhodococcus erythropolis]|uniref:IclR family transcriptional regulator domain-containing protein n=1 Tax=Rhodococcus erythropolis TaxID=1833 RepID=UPI001E4E4618|nr:MULTISPECIES: hypothetical protein [Rhodococcus erythropolis group]MCD2106023.1 hypothetical protein [Rhodococcus qingshengii]MCZ4524447.1 hypothetical protein [Rhodococcus erythropolis]